MLDFAERSSPILEPPAPWNPQLGALTETMHITMEDLINYPKALRAAAWNASEEVLSSDSSATAQTDSQTSELESQQTSGRSNITRFSVHTLIAICYTGLGKRVAFSTAEGPSPKKPKTTISKIPPAAAQLGVDAAECLHNTFGRDHVIGLLVSGRQHALLLLSILQGSTHGPPQTRTSTSGTSIMTLRFK